MLSDYTIYSDGELLGFLQNDDERAFKEIYGRYWKPLFALCAARLKDFQLSEEIVQDVFFNLWRRRQRLKIAGELSHYLSAAVKYEIINARIKQEKSKSRALPFTNIDEDRIATLPDQEHELNDHLAKVINHLPEKSQLVFHSRHQGYSHKEIASELSISEKAVEYHVSKVIKLLRTGLTLLILFFY